VQAASGPTRPAPAPHRRPVAAEGTTGLSEARDARRRGAITGPAGADARTGIVAVILTVFVMAMIVPIFFHVGTLRLSPVRILLLVSVIPLALALLQGRAGPLRAADLFIGLHCLWIGVALIVVEGADRIPFAGITVVELGGGYLVGRVLVRNSAEFARLVAVFLTSLAILAPFAVIEFLTDIRPLQIAAGTIAETFDKFDSSRGRLGFHRVMAGFEHPILFGLYACIALGHVLYLTRWSPGRRALAAAGVSAMTFMALSSAPLLALIIQFGLWLWDRTTGGRWALLGLLAVLVYVALDLASNRTPLTLLIHYLTFDAHTGYIRLVIFDYGFAAALANPVFGIGMGDWPRPAWLTESVDNFWLVTVMRYGFPALVFLVTGVVLGTLAILRARLADPVARNQRTGYMISLAAIFVTLATVHMWGAVSVFVMMWLGAGMWMADAGTPGAASPAPDRRRGTTTPPADAPAPAGTAAPDAPRSRFTRQRKTHPRTPAGGPGA